MNDLALLDFVYMALKDPHTKDRETCIEYACFYGKRYGVTAEDVERILDKKLIDFI